MADSLVVTVAWVSALPKDIELVQVLVTDDLGRYLFVKSLLDRDAIEYLVKGDTIRMAHGWTESHWTESVMEPVEFWVRSEDAERALLLLRDVDAQPPGGEVDSNGDA
jgi:hypothetical protein